MAHLLGTVVAREALHIHLDLHIYLLVTMGHRQPAGEKAAAGFPVPGTEKDV
jgi:hypothetical protein